MATVAQKLARRSGDLVRLTFALPIAVAAAGTTDLAFALPAGARNLAFRTRTTTAFTASTDAAISIGNAVGGAQYVTGTTIKAAGDYAHSVLAGAISELETLPGAPGTQTTVYVRITQTGTPTAVGAATLFVDYALPVS